LAETLIILQFKHSFRSDSNQICAEEHRETRDTLTGQQYFSFYLIVMLRFLKTHPAPNTNNA